MSEVWIICAECTTHVRETESKDGLCFWCTPEGKAKMAEIDARRASATRQAAEGERQCKQ